MRVSLLINNGAHQVLSRLRLFVNSISRLSQGKRGAEKYAMCESGFYVIFDLELYIHIRRIRPISNST